MTITVACVLRSGGVYDAEWVAKLQRGVARHLSLPHRFVAFSDVDVPCERIPLRYDWELLTKDKPRKHNWAVAPKWWSKIELWRPGALPTNETILYLDLDSIITGSLDAIASYPHRFTMAADPWRADTDLPYCSAVMAWRGDYSIIFDKFAADPDGIAHRYDVDEPHRGRIGDQAFIEDTVQADTFRKLMGPVIASYKCDNLQSGPPRNAAVCMFHGLPKMNQITTGWVPELWK
jgi:hypothetical protein